MKLTDIVTLALAIVDTGISKVLKDGKIDKMGLQHASDIIQ